MIAEQHPWWKSTTIYQIYPRSFFDTNGDGIGDIEGIIQKLDYLQDLGVETLWISPFFKSPQVDFGYDISDYCSIAPEYGDLAKAESLIQETHKRGMKILFDMVMNHTSNQHPWFLESKSSLNNPKSDWYIWRDGEGDLPPNNWKSLLGGGSWQYEPERKQWYLASFLPFQPDLNYQNPEVKEAMFNAVRFWLDKGVDGFRLDIFNCIIKDPELRNNPFSWNPFPSIESPGGFFQKREYSVNFPGNFEFAKELRAVIDSYGKPDRILLGEVFGAHPTIKEFIGENQDGLHLIFLFDLLMFKFKASWFRKQLKLYETVYAEPFVPTYVFSNHDQYRSQKRIGNDNRKAKLLALFQLTTRGVATIYYGEETGMTNVPIPLKEAKDSLTDYFKWMPSWIENLLPATINRDRCRTPMQWNSDIFAGFSTAKPWLPIAKDATLRNVAVQQKDPLSLWNWYRQLLQLRKTHPALKYGTVKILDHYPPESLAYMRIHEQETILVCINFSPKTIEIPMAQHYTILAGSALGTSLNNHLRLPAYSGVVILDKTHS